LGPEATLKGPWTDGGSRQQDFQGKIGTFPAINAEMSLADHAKGSWREGRSAREKQQHGGRIKYKSYEGKRDELDNLSNPAGGKW